MKRLVLITGHFPLQKRKNSMLWVSDHLQAQGWHVTHASVGYSWLSRLRGDKRISSLGYVPQTGERRISNTLNAIFGYSPYHPINSRYQSLNWAFHRLTPQFTAYWQSRLATPLALADLVIMESGAPVALGAMVAQLAPQAARIYRVSDDIRLLNAPRALIEAEGQHHHFTRISSSSPLIAKRFAAHPNVTLDPMGVPQAEIKVRRPDPYNRTGQPIAVCAGSTQLDMGELERISRAAPHWDIHVIGRLKSTPPALPNVTWHKEMPYTDTLAHIQHADIGLAPFPDAPGIEYQTTNSNRILLYRCAGVPTLAPARLCTPDIPSLISSSAPDWRTRCETYGRRPEAIPDWSDLAASLVQNGVTDPPDMMSTPPDTMVNPRVKTVPPLASSA